MKRGVLDNVAAAAAASAGPISSPTVRAIREARIGHVEHLAAVAAGDQERWAARTLDELEALERVTGVDMKRRNAVCGGGIGASHQHDLAYAVR